MSLQCVFPCKGKICSLQTNRNIDQIETVQFYNFDDNVLEINIQIFSSFKRGFDIYFLRRRYESSSLRNNALRSTWQTLYKSRPTSRTCPLLIKGN